MVGLDAAPGTAAAGGVASTAARSETPERPRRAVSSTASPTRPPCEVLRPSRPAAAPAARKPAVHLVDSRPSGCLAGRSPGARPGRMPGRAAPGPRQPQRPHDAASPRSPPASWMASPIASCAPASPAEDDDGCSSSLRMRITSHPSTRRVGRAVVVRQRPAGAGPHRAGGAAVAVAEHEVYRPAAAPTLPRHRAMPYQDRIDPVGLGPGDGSGFAPAPVNAFYRALARGGRQHRSTSSSSRSSSSSSRSSSVMRPSLSHPAVLPLSTSRDVAARLPRPRHFQHLAPAFRDVCCAYGARRLPGRGRW